MAIRRPTGPLPLGNKGNGRPAFRLVRPILFPGAGQRTPQRESRGNSPPGALPTAFGATGLTPGPGANSGRASVKRSFQTLTSPRRTPFDLGFGPTGFEQPQVSGFERAPVGNRLLPSKEEKAAQLAPKKLGEGVRVRGGNAIAAALFRRAREGQAMQTTAGQGGARPGGFGIGNVFNENLGGTGFKVGTGTRPEL